MCFHRMERVYLSLVKLIVRSDHRKLEHSFSGTYLRLEPSLHVSFLKNERDSEREAFDQRRPQVILRSYFLAKASPQETLRLFVTRQCKQRLSPQVQEHDLEQEGHVPALVDLVSVCTV